MSGWELGTIVADPLNPKTVYAGGPGGGIIRISYPSEQWINVSPNVDASEALRKVGNRRFSVHAVGIPQSCSSAFSI